MYNFQEVGHRYLGADQSTSAKITQLFSSFVQTIVTEPTLVANARESVSLFINDDDRSPENLVKRLWGEKASEFAALETPFNYLATMQTLLDFIPLKAKHVNHTWLSLGSGPGVYETFLGMWMNKKLNFKNNRIICVDNAPEMVEQHKRIIQFAQNTQKVSLANVQPIVDDMTRLQTIPSDTIEHIICNNSLQWVSDWQSVIAQMHRVMKQSKTGHLYLFVHLHPMSIRGVDEETQDVINVTLGNFDQSELFDALEAHQFEVKRGRLIGAKGYGQCGGNTQRLAIQALFHPTGQFISWRKKTRSQNVSKVVTTR